MMLVTGMTNGVKDPENRQQESITSSGSLRSYNLFNQIRSINTRIVSASICDTRAGVLGYYLQH